MGAVSPKKRELEAFSRRDERVGEKSIVEDCRKVDR
jgi:hypothetical protein